MGKRDAQKAFREGEKRGKRCLSVEGKSRGCALGKDSVGGRVWG